MTAVLLEGGWTLTSCSPVAAPECQYLLERRFYMFCAPDFMHGGKDFDASPIRDAP